MIKLIVSNGKNPTPYKRTTQKQKFVDVGYKTYTAYKALIVAEFIKECKCYPHRFLKPNTKYYVNVVAYYKDKTHGDTDNVAKGVNDALFAKPLSDKYISGSYDYFYDKENPRLEIEIIEDIKFLQVAKHLDQDESELVILVEELG